MQLASSTAVPRLIAGTDALASGLESLIADGIDDVALISGSHWFPSSRFADLFTDMFSGGRIRSYTRSGEPDPDTIDSIAASLSDDPPKAIIGVGGGSVLDTAKAVSVMVCESGSVEELLEGVGTRSPQGRRIGLVAVPTTAGTGSEATKNAVVSRVGSAGYKKSLRHDRFVPDLAIIDPALAVNCPRRVTLAAGLDAVTQLIEAFVSTRSSPFTEAVASRGISMAGESLPVLMDRLDDIDARLSMGWAAWFSGIALANAGLGVIHGLASPLGAIRPASHGEICAALLLPATTCIVGKLTRAGSAGAASEALDRYAQVGRLLSGGAIEESDSGIASSGLIDLLERYRDAWSVPGLASLGYTEDDFASVVDASSTKNTPCELGSDDIRKILEEACR